MNMSINRQDCVVLLLMLLISHATLTFHVTTHNLADQTSCKSCAGYADPAHAVPPSTAESLRPMPGEIGVESAPPTARVAEPNFYRERAPPTLV